jgi:hypothetical protein
MIFFLFWKCEDEKFSSLRSGLGNGARVNRASKFRLVQRVNTLRFRLFGWQICKLRGPLIWRDCVRG